LIFGPLSSTSSAVALLSALIAGVPAAAQTWFPLEPGLRWVYADENRPETTRTVTVVGEVTDGVLVDFNGTEEVIVPGYDIVLPGEGPVLYYRFDEESFLHRDFLSCDDLRILSITARDEEVRTPSGAYTGCLKIEYEPGNCADAGTFVEWWAPDVGKVKWTEGTFIGEQTWLLSKFSSGGPLIKFRRGDADGDGTMQLTDAVGILNYLFLDGEPPACADAADVNDDGQEDLSDAVGVIWYLFQGGDAPPPPGPDFCGEDPTDDQLPPCQPGSCLPR
jgi:hypothetical protein